MCLFVIFIEIIKFDFNFYLHLNNYFSNLSVSTHLKIRLYKDLQITTSITLNIFSFSPFKIELMMNFVSNFHVFFFFGSEKLYSNSHKTK